MKFQDIKTFEQVQVVYGIQNTITGKWYIGSCIDFRARLKRHYYYLRHNIHHSSKLQRSWNKYGEAVFNISIIEYCLDLSIKELLNREEFFIDKYDSYNNGYNMTNICIEYSSHHLTEEQIEKRAQQSRKSVVCINRFTGSVENIFSSVTEAAEFYHDQTTNISSVCNGKLRYVKDTVFIYECNYDSSFDYRVINHHAKGIKWSEERKQKSRIHNKNSKIVYKFNLQGELIKTYISRAEAERQNGYKKEGLRFRMEKEVDGFIYSFNVNYKKDIV